MHEVQGGTSKAADAAIRAIAAAVAEREIREPGSIRRELLGRVAAVLARTAARAVHKRCGRQVSKMQPWSAAVARSLPGLGAGRRLLSSSDGIIHTGARRSSQRQRMAAQLVLAAMTEQASAYATRPLWRAVPQENGSGSHRC